MFQMSNVEKVIFMLLELSQNLEKNFKINYIIGYGLTKDNELSVRHVSWRIVK